MALETKYRTVTKILKRTEEKAKSLKASWSAATRPDRIARLSGSLKLQPPFLYQIVDARHDKTIKMLLTDPSEVGAKQYYDH